MLCPNCHNQSVPEARFCSTCGTAFTPTAPPMPPITQRIVRPRYPRMIAGVCSGIALHYGWNLALVRILFVVFTCITTGAGIIFYLAAWLLLPDAQYTLPLATYPNPVPPSPIPPTEGTTA